MDHPKQHVFLIDFMCPDCEKFQEMEGRIENLLSEIFCAGWPICPDCGMDMEFEVHE